MVRVASPTFVGRAAELAALDDALDAAAQGQTTTILIGGDPGVGKTRLLQTWNDRALQRGARIASGSCLDLGETGPAFTAVVEALRELLVGLGPNDEETLVGPHRSVLARIVPELGGSSDPDAIGNDGPSFAQTRLFDRLADVFQRAATTGPLVLELEDIHWADRSSQAFLLYLVEVSRAANLLLVGTYRPEVAETDAAFRTTLAQLLRRARVSMLPVAPFDDGELREQLTGILGAPPSASLLAAILARSEGNALFAEELAAARDPTVDLPASVGAATASKVEGLSASARAVLRAASVVGRTAPYSVLSQVTSFDDVKLGDALRETVRDRLLEPVHVGEASAFATRCSRRRSTRKRFRANGAASTPRWLVRSPMIPIDRPRMPTSLQGSPATGTRLANSIARSSHRRRQPRLPSGNRPSPKQRPITSGFWSCGIRPLTSTASSRGHESGSALRGMHSWPEISNGQ